MCWLRLLEIENFETTKCYPFIRANREGRTGVFSWYVISWFYFPWNVNLGNYFSWSVARRFCVTRERPELLTDIRDFTALFYGHFEMQALRMVKVVDVYREWLRGSCVLQVVSVDISADYRPICRPTIDRLSTDSRPIVGRHIGRFSACCSSFLKLLSGIEAECTVEAILLLMLSWQILISLATTSTETTEKRKQNCYTTSRQRTCYCCYGQDWLLWQNGCTR